MLYFVTAYLDRQVHMVAIGFTKMVYFTVEALTPEESKEKAKLYIEKTYPPVKINRIFTTKTIQQDESRYTFPENIIR